MKRKLTPMQRTFRRMAQERDALKARAIPATITDSEFIRCSTHHRMCLVVVMRMCEDGERVVVHYPTAF